MPAAPSGGDCRRWRAPFDYRPGAIAAGCSVSGGPGVGPAQHVQAHGGQVWPAVQAGQAQPQPPPPVLLPASGVAPVDILAQAPVGHGAVTHSMLSEIQPQELAVSAAQEAGWSCTEQGSDGVVPQPQGAQAVFAGQAGHPQTDTGADPASVLADGELEPEPEPATEPATVIVVAEPSVHEQLQAGQATPAGHTGQLQVQVPDPPPVPVPVLVPHAPPVPSAPPQLQSQGGPYSPGAHTGQAQVQVPPPVETPASVGEVGGQSHWTGGQDVFAEQ
jgi:hypothetical protein